MADPQMLQHALSLQAEGKIQDAAQLYQQMLKAEPENPDLLNLLGGLMVQFGNTDAAIEVIGSAIKLNPSNPDYYRTLAAAHAKAGDHRQAGGIHLELGAVQQQQEFFEKALADYDLGIAYDAANPHLFNNRGTVLRRLGRFVEAVESFGHALSLDPGMHAALSNRANTHWESGDAKAAFRDHRAALALRPDDPQIRLNLAVALREAGQLEEALTEYDHALKLKPDFAAAHYDRGQLLAQLGHLREGFADMEWRWDPSYHYKEKPRGHHQPLWKGEPATAVKGKLFITSEQGYGDTIQFSRYAPLLAARGYDVLLEVQQPLLRLYQQAMAVPGITIVSRDPPPAKGLRGMLGLGKPPAFAAHLGMLSLPDRFETALDTVPAQIPYLTVADAVVDRWKQRLARDASGKPKVGLVWQGDPKHKQDKTRSLPPALLEPLLARGDVDFFSLQKGAGADWSPASPGTRLVKLGDELEDFHDTAAAIRALDLVITVDTAVAHLAGALGAPVWILLTAIGEWRWLTDIDSSPWYPTARLFRQEAQGEWGAVLRAVESALDGLTAR